jgi:UDP-glucose 4-epimerase
MRVLITGGSGFVGSHLADAFAERGDEVIILDQAPQTHENRAQLIRGDLRDMSAVRSAIQKSDLIVHAAGVLGTHETVLTPIETTEVNVIGTLNVLQATREFDRKLINISKPNVWLNPYSITKDCVEKYCFMYVNEFDTNIAITKLFNVYGPRQKFSGVQKAIPTWIVHGLTERSLEIFGTGMATVDMVHTSDMARAIVAVADNFEACRIRRTDEVAENNYNSFPGYNEQILEVGSGQDLTVIDLADTLSRVLGRNVKIVYSPMRRGEIDKTRLRADISRLTKLSGFRPQVSLEEGLRDTIDYYQKYLPQIQAGELEEVTLAPGVQGAGLKAARGTALHL